MTDVDLDLLLPQPIVLRRGDGNVLAVIPGELLVTEMLKVVELQAEGKRHERTLLDTPNIAEYAEERAEAEAGVKHFYEQCAKFIQDHAEMAVEGDLELTASQIILVITLLGSPQERATLIGEALLRALDLGPEAEDDVPLDEGSPATSSASDGSEDGPPATGARSTGASSSRTARKRSKPKA